MTIDKNPRQANEIEDKLIKELMSRYKNLPLNTDNVYLTDVVNFLDAYLRFSASGHTVYADQEEFWQLAGRKLEPKINRMLEIFRAEAKAYGVQFNA